MATLTQLVTSIQGILQDAAYTEQMIVDRINEALQSIAAGIQMPNGQISPPLPDLYAYGTVNTALNLPFVSLPDDYQRNIMHIYDNSSYRISPPHGGNYYAFSKFLQQIANMGLSEVGSIYLVGVKGTKLYYQGIPSAITLLGFHYYRKPNTLALDGDVPEGIPDHLQMVLVKSWVCKEIMGEKIEAGVNEPATGMNYHLAKFYESMTNLISFVGIDASPVYYGDGLMEDRGACD